MNYIIGIDLDNTIINYEDSLYHLARERGLIDAGVRKDRIEIRDAIRRAHEGEIEWQKLQAEVYGVRIKNTMSFPGVRKFFQLCKKHQIPAHIISHKTEYSTIASLKINLRQAALAWLEKQKFLESVFFEPTRHDKIKRIIQLGCTHFIDDLEETFLDDSFPMHVGKILYGSNSHKVHLPNITVVNSWREINHLFFKNA